MAEIRHYGIPGMKWGRRKGGRTVPVGPGVRGAIKEVGGLVKDAVSDDIGRIASIGRGIAKAMQASRDARYSSDHKAVAGLRKKKVSALSNDEIKKITTRLQLEKQLKDLSKEDKSRGRSFLKGILSNKFANDMISAAIKGAAAAARKRREERDLGG